MNSINAILLQSALLAQAGEGAPTNSFMGPIFMIAMFGMVMYFIVLRPQNRREAERRKMLDQLQKGDAVVTVGGICGVVVGLSDKHAVIRVDEHVKIEFLRSAISQVAASETKE